MILVVQNPPHSVQFKPLKDLYKPPHNLYVDQVQLILAVLLIVILEIETLAVLNLPPNDQSKLLKERFKQLHNLFADRAQPILAAHQIVIQAIETLAVQNLPLKDQFKPHSVQFRPPKDQFKLLKDHSQRNHQPTCHQRHRGLKFRQHELPLKQQDLFVRLHQLIQGNFVVEDDCNFILYFTLSFLKNYYHD
jgi:hypothetical protein